MGSENLLLEGDTGRGEGFFFSGGAATAAGLSFFFTGAGFSSFFFSLFFSSRMGCSSLLLSSLPSSSLSGTLTSVFFFLGTGVRITAPPRSPRGFQL